MILTDYYKFVKTAKKSKTRLDCVASTGSYQEFEEKLKKKDYKGTRTSDPYKAGDLLIYFGVVPDRFGGSIHQKADKSITMESKNLSGVFVPDPEGLLGYGDVRGTGDALLFEFENFSVVDGEIQEGSTLEIFVARGKSKDRVALYNVFSDGGLDYEKEALRQMAVNKTTTTHKVDN